MDHINGKKEGKTSDGFSLSFGDLRNWLLVAAMVFGLFASCLATQTIASAKTGEGRLANSLNQQDSGAVKNAPAPANVTFTKTGPSSLKNGGTASYNFNITNSDPITHEAIFFDLIPTALTYTGSTYFTDGTSYLCSSGEVDPTDPYFLEELAIFFPSKNPADFANFNAGLACITIVGPNSSLNIGADFIASGSNGECVTNFSSAVIDNYAITTAQPNAISSIKSKEDLQKNIRAVVNAPAPYIVQESDWTSCFPSDAAKPPADLVAQLRVTPDRTDFIGPNGDISYNLSLKNQGIGDANRVQVTFPFDASLDVGYLTSANPNVWVSKVDTTSAQHTVTVEFPTIQPNATVSATLVMRPSATAATGTSEFNRFTVKWDDAEKAGKTQGSNGVRYALSDQEGSTLNLNGGEVQLFDPATATVSNGQTQLLKGDFFAPGEKVTAWYTAPDGTSTDLGSALAGPNGEITITIAPINLTTGAKYNVSAYGNRSGVYGSSVITIGSGS